MTFLAPVFLVAAVGAALLVVGLHFLVTRPPSLVAFPTTRFIPSTTIVVTSVARRPQDILLLILRVLALLAIGTAFAQPVFVPRQRHVARVIVLDQSRYVSDPAAARDSARRWLGADDRLIVVDTSARIVSIAALDSMGNIGAGAGSLSAGLIQARRVAAELQLEADSIELVLVSPLVQAGTDEATFAIREQWPGRIQLVAVPARRDSTPRTLAMRSSEDDPLRATVALVAGKDAPQPNVRLVRDRSTIDSQWVRAGGTLVEWPIDARPTGWSEVAGDTVSAVVGGPGAIIHSFPRGAALDPLPPGHVVIARWIDGTPAATEVALGSGCVRQVALPITARGDFVLRPDVQRLVRALIERCIGQVASPGIPEAQQQAIAGGGPLATRDVIAPPEAPETPLVPWLLALGILLLLAELIVRRSSAAAPAETVPMARAA